VTGREGGEEEGMQDGECERQSEREGGSEGQDNIKIANIKCKYVTTDIPYHKVIAPL